MKGLAEPARLELIFMVSMAELVIFITHSSIILQSLSNCL